MGRLRKEVQDLLQKNEVTSSLERLERSEFIIDAAGHDKLLAEIDAKVAARRKEYEGGLISSYAVLVQILIDFAAEIARLNAAVTRLKAACWEPLEVQVMFICLMDPVTIS